MARAGRGLSGINAQVLQWDVGLREKRADCYMHLREYGKALSDIRATTKLLQDSTEAYYKMAMISYDMGDSHESLRCVCDNASINHIPFLVKLVSASNWMPIILDVSIITRK